MTQPIQQRSSSNSLVQFQAAFVVRVWRTRTESEWRCHLIEVASGQHLTCQRLEEVASCIAAWLPPRRQHEQAGIR